MRSDGLPDIYIHRCGSDYTETWHLIKLSSSSRRRKRRVRDEFLEAKLPPLPIDLTGFASASIGSHIYVSGGIRFPSDTEFRPTPRVNYVYHINTHDPNPKWEEAPQMISGREHHYAFADEGKLYVISGHNTLKAPVYEDGTQLFAEVYDPTSGEGWKELAHAAWEEDDVLQGTVIGHAVVDNGCEKKILFHSFFEDQLSGILLGSETLFVQDDGFSPSICASACVDGILYYLDSRRMLEMYAYDVNKPGSEHKLVTFSKMKRNHLPYRPFGDPIPTSCLLSIGNRILAVIWGQECYSGSMRSLRVHCSILEMSKANDSFNAKVLNYSNYIMGPGSLARCLAIWPPQEDIGMDSNVVQNTEGLIKSKNKRKKENRGTKKR